MKESVRQRLKSMLRILPDRLYISLQFRLHMGYFPDLKNPKSFNEKLQWLKLYDRDSRYNDMVDKCEAKKIVAATIGEQYVIPTLGVWERFEDIDFSALPDQFVLKCTHDSGSVVICKDKMSFDIEAARNKINRCLNNNFFWSGREWPYKDVKPRIIAEEFMAALATDDAEVNLLNDYKFFCFNGKPKFLYISRGLDKHETGEIAFYGLDGVELPFHRSDYPPYHNALIPENFEEMKQIASKLAEHVDTPFIRVDLYSVNNSVLFSEFTFTPCLGALPFEPKSVDLEIGDMLRLPQRTSKPK